MENNKSWGEKLPEILKLVDNQGNIFEVENIINSLDSDLITIDTDPLEKAYDDLMAIGEEGIALSLVEKPIKLKRN